MMRTFIYWILIFSFYVAGVFAQMLDTNKAQAAGGAIGLIVGVATVMFAIYLGDREKK